jgi:aminoglycoside phosphotransferase family enzyme/predicted kinase
VARRGTARRARRPLLVAALADPSAYPHAVERVRVLETHISWVFLTGTFVYKIKKPLKLPFLDFSTLRRRQHFCREEVRLNRRLARKLYVGVVPIGGTRAAPRVGRKPALEYAVKMREFPAGARLDQRLAAGLVPHEAIAAFAATLAEFHGGLPRVRGRAETVTSDALANVSDLSRYLNSAQRELAPLRVFTQRETEHLHDLFARRAAAGAHRECHGDLHLQNLLWQDGAIVAYDALEFDRRLREIDVMNEAAFLAMDLHAHGRSDLAHVFLNRYLEVGGDYAGVDVLRFYLVYRALVRAKVAAIKRAQGTPTERGYAPYVRAALDLKSPQRPVLVITHGFSGSGKTHVTDALVGALPALRVRSDLERKRLVGLSPLARTGSAVGAGVYAPQLGRRTYAALAASAERLLRAGFHAIVDAAFLRRADRAHFRQVAAASAAGFAILDCRASVTELKRRVLARERAGRDASEANLAVLASQLATHEPLDRAERRSAVTVDTERAIRAGAIARTLAQR